MSLPECFRFSYRWSRVTSGLNRRLFKNCVYIHSHVKHAVSKLNLCVCSLTTFPADMFAVQRGLTVTSVKQLQIDYYRHCYPCVSTLASSISV